MKCLGVLLLLICGLAHADLLLVQDGQQPYPIYQPATATKWEKQAATQLAAYLGKMSGATFTVQAPEGAPARGIFVGPADKALAARLGTEGYILVVTAERLEIRGATSRALIYGVYGLLEQLGCRWWSHNEEDIPTCRTITLPPMERVVIPPFIKHDLWNREAQTTDNDYLNKANATSTITFSGEHTLIPLLKGYLTEHPEALPMEKNGQRQANNIHLCYSAPGMAEALAAALSAEVKKRGGNVANVIYFAGMGDWYGGMCQCPVCAKIYAEETWTDPNGRVKPGYQGTLLRMINRTAELLEKEYPGIRVGTYAYMSLEAPPAKTVPRDNVVIRVPRLRHCTVHAADSCAKNASFARNLERWCEIAPGRVYVGDYGASFNNFLPPFPCLKAIAGNIAYYHRIGVAGVEILGNYGSYGSDLVVLKNFVWRRILQQPDLEVAPLLREFCTGYYGPAADDIVTYVTTLEQSVAAKDAHADEFADFTFLTPEVRKKLKASRDKALARVAGNEPYERRVREATIGLEALILWKVGPLQEQNGRLIRTDLGGDTFARAQAVLRFTREACPTEFGSGPAHRMNFLTWHGGPLVTLSQGPLTVTVAPVLNGQLRQISYQGVPLLYVETDPKTTGYPLVGGSIENARTRMMTLVGEPTTTSATMTGDSGIGIFDTRVEHLIRKTISLTPDGSINVVSIARKVMKDKVWRGATVTTVYRAEKQPEQMRVEYQTVDGNWQPSLLAAGKDEAVLPACMALRVSMLARKLQVVDLFTGAGIKNGTWRIDGKKGTLTIVVNTIPVRLPEKDEALFLTRDITVRPMLTANPVAP